ncbi:MAG: T9SS type A sorting domain-containing protein [Bacteroidetes bacterium]|nr:T9SS type A sorting domain-containing protein [Bacteroidota bacterium]
MLGGIRTDGYPGSDNPGASFPTVYTLNQEAYEWEAVSSANQQLEQGEGLLVYIFDEDTPKNPMLNSNGPWAPLNGNFNYDEILGYDPNQGAFGESHFLIGNPHPVGIDICTMLVEGENMATSFDIWVPSLNNGNGGYANVSCSIPAKQAHTAFDERDNQLFAPPFAGFWVRTTDENPSLAITEEDYQRYDQRVSKEKREYEPLTLLLNHDEKNYKEVVHILFSDEAEIGLDRIDATKLSSAGLAERYLSFFAMDQENRAYALRSLPEQIRELVVPLGVETTETGSFTLDWSLPSEAGLNYLLRDTKTGEEFRLERGSEYHFNISENEIVKMTKKQVATAKMGSAQKTDTITPRFELVINRVGTDTPKELPATITLDQNYPNPFNPSTVIRYQLPEAAQVSLEVFDMAGRKVADLVNGQVSAGSHTVNFDASQLSSGIYMYRLQTGSTTLTRKLTVVK